MRVRCRPFATSSRSFFFFNATATTEIYTLSLHDALPISAPALQVRRADPDAVAARAAAARDLDLALPASLGGDRKSTRLNSSHTVISYAVFCLKKKKTVPCTTPARPTPSRNRRYAERACQ